MPNSGENELLRHTKAGYESGKRWQETAVQEPNSNLPLFADIVTFLQNPEGYSESVNNEFQPNPNVISFAHELDRRIMTDPSAVEYETDTYGVTIILNPNSHIYLTTTCFAGMTSVSVKRVDVTRKKGRVKDEFRDEFTLNSLGVFRAEIKSQNHKSNGKMMVHNSVKHDPANPIFDDKVSHAFSRLQSLVTPYLNS